MYTIDLDEHIIYNPLSTSSSICLLKADLEMEDNTAGSFAVTFPPDNPAIDLLEQYTSIVTIYKDGEWYWSGRCVTQLTKDIFGQASCTFEGILAVLNDTIQSSAKFENYTIAQFLDIMLQKHNISNSYVSAPVDKRFYVGTVTVNDGTKDRYTEYETTLKCINDLVEDNGGHLVVRKRAEGGYYLDYLADYNPVNSQYINFGKNILDFNRSYSMKEFATVIRPFGKEQENGEKVDITTVNSGAQCLYDPDKVIRWGWIEKVAENSEIETPAALKTWAQTEYDAMVARIDLELEVSAIDLHNLDSNIQEIKMRDQVRVISYPHGVDEIMPVVKMTKNLLDPASDKFTIGTVVNTTLTTADGQFKSMIEDQVKSLPSETSVLVKAKAQAAALINSATTGYVTVRPDAIYISDNEDYTHATKLWKWTMGGLGYSNDGGQTYDAAITMNGEIVADFITTGVLNADIIKAGTIQDTGGNTSWDLTTGTFTMTKGSISLGTTTSTNPYLDGYRFNVAANGRVTTSNDIRLVSTSNTSASDFIVGRTPDTPQDLMKQGMMLDYQELMFFYDTNAAGSSSYAGACTGFVQGIYPGEYTSNPNLYGLEIRACNGGTSTSGRYNTRGGCLNLDMDRLTVATETSGSGSYNFYVGGNGTVTVGGVTLRFVHGIMVTDLS